MKSGMSEEKDSSSGDSNGLCSKARANEDNENSKKIYMKMLSKYNDVKDATQIVLGVIANVEGTTVRKIHEKFELPLRD